MSRSDAATPIDPLLARLGERVRFRRKSLAMTLRELAGETGLSERFLVLLEGGRANVSVVRLEAVGRALGTSGAGLLAEDPALPTTAAAEPRGRRLVALLGLRGAGKTTIGRRAAERLGIAFVELDGLVAERAGMSLGELIELHGMEYYRRLERQELERLADAGERALVATGGGLVTEHATFARLRAAAFTVWLRATPEDHYARVVAQGDVRPMANRADAMDELRGLLRARRALYESADAVVDTSALELGRAVDRVVQLSRRAGGAAARDKDLLDIAPLEAQASIAPKGAHKRKASKKRRPR